MNREMLEMLHNADEPKLLWSYYPLHGKESLDKASTLYSPEELDQAAFKDGVLWFLDNLWRSMNEVPSHDGFILLKYSDKEKDCFGYGVLHTDTDLELYLYDEDLKEEASDKWLNFCNNEAKAKFEWCYLRDLLPF